MMLSRPRLSMHGHSILSFFTTKKNPTPVGEAEGRIRPAFRQFSIYVSIALVPIPRVVWYPGEGRSCSHREGAAKAKWPGPY